VGWWILIAGLNGADDEEEELLPFCDLEGFASDFGESEGDILVSLD